MDILKSLCKLIVFTKLMRTLAFGSKCVLCVFAVPLMAKLLVTHLVRIDPKKISEEKAQQFERICLLDRCGLLACRRTHMVHNFRLRE